jgi:hypothetical protein
MTTTSFVTAYAALALAFWIHALHGLSVRNRSRRRQRLLGREEAILIALVALLASSAWIVLLPIRLIGGAQLAYERRARGLWSRLGHWRRAGTVAGRA